MFKSRQKPVPQVPLTDFEKQQIKCQFLKMIQNSRYEIRTDDIYITRWLTILDWNAKAAFKRLTRFHKFRKEHPDWHFSRHAVAYDQLLKRNIAVMLPHRDKNGRRVYLMHACKMDTSEVTIEEMGQIDTIWFESILDEAETQQNGVTIIIDMKDIKWRLLKWLTPQNSYYSSVFAEVAPVKAYNIHLVNTSNLVYKFMKIVMPFMMKGILKKMSFHSSDLKTLHDALGRDCLPPQYGGPETNTINYDELRRKLYKALEEKEKLIVAMSS